MNRFFQVLDKIIINFITKDVQGGPYKNELASSVPSLGSIYAKGSSSFPLAAPARAQGMSQEG